MDTIEPTTSAAISRPGIYQGLPAETYHALCTPAPALSAGFAWRLIQKCPALAWYGSPLNPAFEPENKPAFDIGTAAHLMFLEPEHFSARIVAIDAADYRTAAAKAARDAAYLAGKTPLLDHQVQQVCDMRRALHNETQGLPFRTAPSFAADGFRGGEAEVSYFWKHRGTWQKSRADYVKPRIIVDYKTSSVDELDRVAFNMGWHLRAAHYLDGHKALTGEAAEYWFVCQSKDAPYLVTVNKLDSDSLGWGRIQLEMARATFAKCLRTGQWPAHPDRANIIALPSWAQMRLQDRHDAGEFDAEQIYEMSRRFGAPLDMET